MNTTFSTSVVCICLALGAGTAFAQDTMMKESMTMQQCKDHMAMKKKDGMKADEMSMKKDKMCADMMKKDEMMKKDGMMKDGAASAPAKM